MKNIFKRAVSYIIIGSVCITTGCAVEEEYSNDKVGNTKDALISAQISENITISLWSFPVFSQEDSKSYEEEVIDAFEEKYPNIHIEFEKLDYTTGADKIDGAINNGSVCDILFDAPGRIMLYAKDDRLARLDDLFTSQDEKDIGNKNLLNACKSDNTYYMYPLSSAPFYMAFNKSMLEDAGVLSLVKEGWTTDDFTTVVRALKDKNYVPGAVFCKDQGGDQGTRAFIANLFSSKIISDDLSEYTINDKNGVKGMDFVANLVKDGYITNGSNINGTRAIENFVNGQASFTILWGPSQQNSYSDELSLNNIETVEVPYPSDDGEPELEYLVNGFCVFDNEDAQKISAAKKFIDFICNDKVFGKMSVIKTGCAPVKKGYDDIYTDKRMNIISSWSNYYGTYYNAQNGFMDMRTCWYETLQSVLVGRKSAKEALDYFVECADDTLNE